MPEAPGKFIDRVALFSTRALAHRDLFPGDFVPDDLVPEMIRPNW